jgi:subtilase family serine protease
MTTRNVSPLILGASLLFSNGLLITGAAAADGQIDELHQEAHRPLIKRFHPDSKTPVGYTPAQIRHAYGIDLISNQGEGQVIGIVDGYDYPNAEADLGVFTSTYNLPACTQANGCLTIVYPSGVPKTNRGWTGETSLDLQWAHAIAPAAKIVLVLAKDGQTSTLLKAVPVAVQNGATVVNMSWGTLREFAGEQQYDSMIFGNPAVTYFNASGDDGNNLFGYPAASTLVVGAGGTSLKLDASGSIESETAWSGSGGGESKYESEPSYQIGAQSSGQRGVPDVAWDSDPSTGVAVYDSEDGNWAEVGGTSASSPQWCGLTAIANSMRAQQGKGTIGASFLPTVYANPLAFHDIASGSNGSCGMVCDAGPGYDFVTGLGSANGPLVVAALVAAP